MTPLPLEKVSADSIPGAEKRLMAAIEDAVQAMGLGTAAGALGVKPNVLRGALDGAGGRHFPPGWGAVIAKRVGPGQLSDRIRQAVKELFDMLEPEDDETFVHTLEAGYAHFGQAGVEKLAELRRKARRV